MYLIFDSLEKCEKALEKINSFFGFPDNQGTKTWDLPNKAYNLEKWYIKKPEIEIEIEFNSEEKDVSQYLQPIILK